MRWLNLKWVAEKLARGLTQIRGAIYAPIVCTALALAFYSCNEPPAQLQPTPLSPPDTIVVATPVATTRTPQSPTVVPTAQPQITPSLHTPTPIAPTPQPPIAPTPIAIPNLVPLPGRVPFTQVTAGKYHACGLQADGTPLCWGSNVNDSLNIPARLTLSRISAGLNFTCGLRPDRTIACWGQNDTGQASPPNGRFDEVAAGRDHACALNEGALTCWGSGFTDGAEAVQEVPPLSSIQAGLAFTCGLTPSADMACWYLESRELVINPGPFIDTGIGLHHACAIRVDRTAFCVQKYQDHSRRSQPPPTKFVQISGGWRHACGITEASDIECWGSGAPSAQGERLNAPKGKFTAISIGWRNSCALNPDGYATCWQQPDVQNPSDLSEAFGGVSFEWPVDLFSLPNGEIAVVELKGTIAAYSDEPNAAPPKTILDLTDRTVCCNDESGMLSAALDPQFEKFPFLYVYYNLLNKHAYGEDVPELVSRLARFRIERGRAVRDSELTILDVVKPRKWHYGGAIRFGADGMLYLGIGDNTSAEKAQSLDSLLGKIIRIDVRGATPGQPYLVPPDNPFVNNPDACPEIWAYGLRNPWRMDFAPDGRLFVGDAGSSIQEEISLAATGANLGWPMCEGSICEEWMEADAAVLTAPIFTYGREDGCAVVGGVTAPRLDNGFIFGDYCSGKVWLLEQEEREGWRARILAQVEGRILSFGAGVDETVYILKAYKPIDRLQSDVGEE